MSSKYIIIDGPDGTGKTTLASLLSEEVESSKKIHFPTRLPEEDDLSDSTTEILFYLNDFNKNLVQNSHSEKTLILDRSFVSTMAYQGFQNSGHKRKDWVIDTIMGIGSEMIKNRDEVCFVHLTCSTPERIDRLKGKNDQDRIGRLEEEELRSKLTELDRTFRRSYSILEKNYSEFTYLQLDSTNSPPESFFKEISKQLS